VSGAIHIRTANFADLPVLEREMPLNTPTRHRECLAQQDEGRIAYVVAWQGHVPAGHGLLHWPGPRDAAVAAHLSDCPEIFMLGVPEPLRSRGSGRLLVARLERLASDRGKRRIGLGVARTNPGARRLYERLGYADVGAPPYVDRWYWIDASGVEDVEKDPCVFLVKELPAIRRGPEPIEDLPDLSTPIPAQR
jgi:GNAT superfamily N-acetyltransferase